jgi:hypothetical protein
MSCRYIGDDHKFISADVSRECLSDEHIYYIKALILPGFLIYSLIFPTIIIYLL